MVTDLEASETFQCCFSAGTYTSGASVRALVRTDASDAYQVAYSDNSGGSTGAANMPVPPDAYQNSFLKVRKFGDDVVFESIGDDNGLQSYTKSGTANTITSGFRIGSQLNSINAPLLGKVSAVIILNNPTPQQEADVELVLREYYLKQSYPFQLTGTVASFLGEDIVESAGNAVSWPDSLGNFGTMAPFGGASTYVSNWSNGRPAFIPGATLNGNGGRLQTTTGSIPAGPRTYVVAGEFPSTNPGTGYAGMSAYTGKPFYFFIRNGVIGSNPDGGVGDASFTNIPVNTFLGRKFLAVLRSQAGDHQLSIFVDGLGEFADNDNYATGPSAMNGNCAGGWYDFGGGWPSPLAEQTIINRFLEDSEADFLLENGANYYGLQPPLT